LIYHKFCFAEIKKQNGVFYIATESQKHRKISVLQWAFVQLPERLIIFVLLKLDNMRFDTLPHLPAMPSAGKPVGRESQKQKNLSASVFQWHFSKLESLAF